MKFTVLFLLLFTTANSYSNDIYTTIDVALDPSEVIETIDFQSMRTYDSKTLTVKLINSSDELILRKFKVEAWGAWYDSFDNCGKVIEPLSECLIDIELTPFENGWHTGSLRIDSDSYEVRIGLSGASGPF